MHPKKLRDICIDAIIRLTINIEDGSKDVMEKYTEIKRVWDEFWQLPQHLPKYAGEILLSYLFNRMELEGNLTLQLIVALAANLKKIKVYNRIGVNSMGGFKETFLSEECNVFCSNVYQLQELDFPSLNSFYIGLSQDLIVSDILIRLLPRCPSLTVLKLSGIIKEDVLVAAKTCPLVVLQIGHISYPHSFKLKNMKKIFFGMPDLDLDLALMKMKGGENSNLKPTWPNLVDLSITTTNCAASIDFFVLVLLTHKKLQYIDSEGVDINECLEKYLQIKREIPQSVCQSLRGRVITCRDMNYIKTYKSVLGCLQSLEFHIFDTFDDILLKELQVFVDASLFPEELIVVYDSKSSVSSVHNYPTGFFSAIGKNVEMLKIFVVSDMDRTKMELSVLGDILLDLPVLKKLELYGQGYTCSRYIPAGDHCFPNITSLLIRSQVGDANDFWYMFKMFSHLQQIECENHKNIIINLKPLLALRILKVFDLNQADISHLIELPRNTQDGQRFELYASLKSLSESDINRIQNSGWNLFHR